MNRRVLSSAILVAAVLFLWAQSAMALPQTSASFDPATQRVNVAISGGDNGTTYTVHVAPTGCVDTAAGGSIDLVGPDASGFITLNCLAPNSTGGAAVSFCMDVVCFDTKEMVFSCRSDCTIYAAGQVPALGHWSMAVVVLLIIGTAAWIVRRKKAAVH